MRQKAFRTTRNVAACFVVASRKVSVFTMRHFIARSITCMKQRGLMKYPHKKLECECINVVLPLVSLLPRYACKLLFHLSDFNHIHILLSAFKILLLSLPNHNYKATNYFNENTLSSAHLRVCGWRGECIVAYFLTKILSFSYNLARYLFIGPPWEPRHIHGILHNTCTFVLLLLRLLWLKMLSPFFAKVS